MSEIEQRRADRLRVMAAISKQVGANEHATAQLFPIRDDLGFTDDYMGTIASYLAGEGLIEPLRLSTGSFTPMLAHITHLGIKEMELSEERPTTPTDHFPPSNGITINVGGNIVGSPFQVGNSGSTQHYQAGAITVGADTKMAIGNFVSAFEAKADELKKEKSPDQVAEIAAEMATIKAQINSPKPKKHFIMESLASVRAVLEHGAGGVVTAGLLALIALIHL